MAGANGLNFCLFLIEFTRSLMSSPLGSASNDLLPSARGPNSALPLATPTILLSFNSFMSASTGYSPSMLCPRNGCCQSRCFFSCAAMQPRLDPASPGFGMIHMLSNNPMLANTLFAAQFNATPPAYTRLREPYLLALCHNSARHSSVTACMLAAMSMTSAFGSQSLSPLCKFCLSLNGDCSTKSSYIFCLYFGVPYAAMPIRMYSSSAGLSPQRCVNALYNIPMLCGYCMVSFLSM